MTLATPRTDDERARRALLEQGAPLRSTSAATAT
jgi:hypothetical protein